MKILLRLLLKSQHQRKRFQQTKTEKGMTLIELLIGTVMAFLIITPMLSFVVDMLNTDRREQVKSNTEQDIQAAVDFIAQDLSQAIYIYDGKGINAIKAQLPANDANKIPILVFWKRQQVKNAVPLSTGLKPNDCRIPGISGGTIDCNDTYVRSLVAYYQIKETDPKSIWCQPSGNDCPKRIARYEIRDGLKNPYATGTMPPYYTDTDIDARPSLKQDAAFNTDFKFSDPTKDVTKVAGLPDAAQNSQVLVNYIDHSPKTIALDECQQALGNPETQIGLAAAQKVAEDTLKVTDPDKTINSFYACVDTSRNLARVTIRGNSQRRLQPNNANYDANKSAFFPTTSVQVQGIAAIGK
ncbi:hormogonium polysaccharide secretion pseudopilin HpsC [Microcoleus sp. CAWBG58]|uniref:hormogonium polysaccharide secretion pseudopilin HpsC n=1 Tax=Microcoleus sp. CAWBG58 TaxID=2841651 RepID=UPI0025E4CF5D|nr:hormogonium polysaccharide secretion pseudopilin HpsC [Microcoleus sp. CAWBG58]